LPPRAWLKYLRWAAYGVAAIGVLRLWYAASVDVLTPDGLIAPSSRAGDVIAVARSFARQGFELVASLTDRFGVGVAATAMTVAFTMRLRRTSRPTQAQRASDVVWVAAAAALGLIVLADVIAPATAPVSASLSAPAPGPGQSDVGSTPND